MKTIIYMTAIVFLLLVLPVSGQEEKTYVGSETCQGCHLDKYKEWMASGHPYKLRKAEEVENLGLPIPPYATWDNISYVIGGYGWKARYVNTEGYILGTEEGWNQYDMEWERFSDYHKGEVNKPYNCGTCHTTGYSEEGHQDGLEGIVGTWAEEGIGCEACHGPGSAHVAAADGSQIEVDTSSELCGNCHYRKYKDERVIASGGFIKHHEQYNEIQNSKHASISCVSCHDPHIGVQDAVKKGEFGYVGETYEEFVGKGIRQQCTDCHQDQADALAKSTMGQAGVTCIDCHMPEAAKSAHVSGGEEPLHGKGLSTNYLLRHNDGDIKSHLFKINTDPEAELLNEEGDLANGYLTLGWACGTCHPAKDKEWAAKFAKGDIHSLKLEDRDKLKSEISSLHTELNSTRAELQSTKQLGQKGASGPTYVSLLAMALALLAILAVAYLWTRRRL